MGDTINQRTKKQLRNAAYGTVAFAGLAVMATAWGKNVMEFDPRKHEPLIESHMTAADLPKLSEMTAEDKERFRRGMLGYAGFGVCLVSLVMSMGAEDRPTEE